MFFIWNILKFLIFENARWAIRKNIETYDSWSDSCFLWLTLVGILISLAIYGIFSSKSAKLFPLEGVAEKKALKN